MLTNQDITEFSNTAGGYKVMSIYTNINGLPNMPNTYNTKTAPKLIGANTTAPTPYTTSVPPVNGLPAAPITNKVATPPSPAATQQIATPTPDITPLNNLKIMGITFTQKEAWLAGGLLASIAVIFLVKKKNVLKQLF